METNNIIVMTKRIDDQKKKQKREPACCVEKEHTHRIKIMSTLKLYSCRITVECIKLQKCVRFPEGIITASDLVATTTFVSTVKSIACSVYSIVFLTSVPKVVTEIDVETVQSLMSTAVAENG